MSNFQSFKKLLCFKWFGNEVNQLIDENETFDETFILVSLVLLERFGCQ